MIDLGKTVAQETTTRARVTWPTEEHLKYLDDPRTEAIQRNAMTNHNCEVCLMVKQICTIRSKSFDPQLFEEALAKAKSQI